VSKIRVRLRIDHLLLADGGKAGTGDAIPPPLVVPDVREPLQ
jgi:hypothetical protein